MVERRTCLRGPRLALLLAIGNGRAGERLTSYDGCFEARRQRDQVPKPSLGIMSAMLHPILRQEPRGFCWALVARP